MGLCNRINSKCKDDGLQDIPIKSNGTKRTRRILKRTTRNGENRVKQIPDGIPILLCKEERRKIMTSTGLPKVKRNDNKKPISSPTNLRTN